jgi:hypothetical protein
MAPHSCRYKGYSIEADRTRQELDIAEAQLRDYQARLGRSFPHEQYLSRLTALRDQLKAALSGLPPEPGAEPLPVAELSDSIKALKAAHTIEAEPQRTVSRQVSAEEPVTACIRRQGEAISCTMTGSHSGATSLSAGQAPPASEGPKWQHRLADVSPNGSAPQSM